MKTSDKTQLIIFTICISIFFTACNEAENIKEIEIKGNPELQIDLLKSDTNNLKEFTNLFDKPKIISLKSKDSSFFVASIEKLIVFNNEMFILDDRFSNLLRFDSSGYFINNYGKIGLGKNEYSKINDFDIDIINKWVVIFSNSDKSLYYYSLETGSFIKRVNIKLFGSQICTLPNNQIMLYRNFSNEAKEKAKDYNIIIIDSVGKATSKAFPFNSAISFIEWRASGFLRKTNGNLFFLNPFSDTIFKYHENSFEPFIETNILSENIRKIREDHDKLFKSKAIVDSSASYMGSSFLKNDQFIVFDYAKDRRVKTAVYDIKKNTFVSMSTKYKTDPLITLALTPVYLKSDNTIFFKFNLKDLLRAKSKYPELFKKLSDSNQIIVNDTSQKTGTFLLVSKIKNN
jgi:hypothetical protein